MVGSRRGSASDSINHFVFPRLVTAGGNEGTQREIELELVLRI